jgi:hypothetical protein
MGPTPTSTTLIAGTRTAHQIPGHVFRSTWAALVLAIENGGYRGQIRAVQIAVDIRFD